MALLHHPLRHKVERPTSPSLRAREQEIREQRRRMDSFQMFHMVAEAFEVLEDPQKRAIYDLYGEKGLKEGLPGPDGFIPPYVYHGDPHRTFKDFFGTDNPFIDLLTAACVPIDYFAGSESSGLRPKEPPIFRDLWLDMEELYTGCVKKVMICKKTVIGEGNQMEFREKVLTIPIQPGTPSGAQFSFPNEGDQGPNVQPGTTHTHTLNQLIGP
jgi:DnaJ family protein B protein 13